MAKRKIPNVPSELEQALANAIADLRPGEVVSYGDIAQRAGHPGTARQAGRVLKRGGDDLPWWRVVYASGQLAPCNPEVQRERLQAEGVIVEGTRILRSPRGRFTK